MKKLLLTGVMAICTLFVSAQFMVVTTVTEAPDDSDGFAAEQITDKIGLGYMLNDQLTAGVSRGPEDAAGDATWDLFVRYSFEGGVWATLSMPSEDGSDNMKAGIGYSFNVWNNFWVEPRYEMQVNEPEGGEREGELRLGLGYRF